MKLLFVQQDYSDDYIFHLIECKHNGARNVTINNTN